MYSQYTIVDNDGSLELTPTSRDNIHISVNLIVNTLHIIGTLYMTRDAEDRWVVSSEQKCLKKNGDIAPSNKTRQKTVKIVGERVCKWIEDNPEIIKQAEVQNLKNTLACLTSGYNEKEKELKEILSKIVKIQDQISKI